MKTMLDSFLIAEKIVNNNVFQIVKNLENRLHGNFNSIFHGSGLDLKEIRNYTQNDDIRNIDWNVTARMNEPHVRVYSEEKELISWLILDVSPSMDFGSDYYSKKDILMQFAAVITCLCTKRGDRTGAILFNNDIEEIIPPSKGIKQALIIVKKLIEFNNKKNNEKKNFTTEKIKNIIGRKKSVFFVSDFIFPNSGWEKTFGEICTKNELIPVQIIDNIEEKIPDIGYLSIINPETNKQLTINTSNKKFMEKYNQLLFEEKSKVEKILSISKNKTLKIYTDSDLTDVLTKYSNKWR